MKASMWWRLLDEKPKGVVINEGIWGDIGGVMKEWVGKIGNWVMKFIKNPNDYLQWVFSKKGKLWSVGNTLRDLDKKAEVLRREGIEEGRMSERDRERIMVLLGLARPEGAIVSDIPAGLRSLGEGLGRALLMQYRNDAKGQLAVIEAMDAAPDILEVVGKNLPITDIPSSAIRTIGYWMLKVLIKGVEEGGAGVKIEDLERAREEVSPEDVRAGLELEMITKEMEELYKEGLLGSRSAWVPETYRGAMDVVFSPKMVKAFDVDRDFHIYFGVFSDIGQFGQGVVTRTQNERLNYIADLVWPYGGGGWQYDTDWWSSWSKGGNGWVILEERIKEFVVIMEETERIKKVAAFIVYPEWSSDDRVYLDSAEGRNWELKFYGGITKILAEQLNSGRKIYYLGKY